MVIKKVAIPKYDSGQYFISVLHNKKTKVVSVFLIRSDTGQVVVSCGLKNTVPKFSFGVQLAYRRATFSGEGDIVLANFIHTRKKSMRKILERLIKEIY